jgi:hypothetical protein
MSVELRKSMPSLAEVEYDSETAPQVLSFDLSKAPVGQAFLISRLGHNPLHGVVEEAERPVVSLREHGVINAPESRWLQVFVSYRDLHDMPNDEQALELRGITRYHEAYLSGVTPLPSTPLNGIGQRYVSFLEIDHDGQAVRYEQNDDPSGVVNIKSVSALGLQLLRPFMPELFEAVDGGSEQARAYKQMSPFGVQLAEEAGIYEPGQNLLKSWLTHVPGEPEAAHL